MACGIASGVGREGIDTDRVRAGAGGREEGRIPVLGVRVEGTLLLATESGPGRGCERGYWDAREGCPAGPYWDVTPPTCGGVLGAGVPGNGAISSLDGAGGG